MILNKYYLGNLSISCHYLFNTFRSPCSTVQFSILKTRHIHNHRTHIGCHRRSLYPLPYSRSHSPAKGVLLQRSCWSLMYRFQRTHAFLLRLSSSFVLFSLFVCKNRVFICIRAYAFDSLNASKNMRSHARSAACAMRIDKPFGDLCDNKIIMWSIRLGVGADQRIQIKTNKLSDDSLSLLPVWLIARMVYWNSACAFRSMNQSIASVVVYAHSLNYRDRAGKPQRNGKPFIIIFDVLLLLLE